MHHFKSRISKISVPSALCCGIGVSAGARSCELRGKCMRHPPAGSGILAEPDNGLVIA
jgi:hypothetical protein